MHGPDYHNMDRQWHLRPGCFRSLNCYQEPKGSATRRQAGEENALCPGSRHHGRSDPSESVGRAAFRPARDPASLHRRHGERIATVVHRQRQRAAAPLRFEHAGNHFHRCAGFVDVRPPRHAGNIELDTVDAVPRIAPPRVAKDANPVVVRPVTVRALGSGSFFG